MSTNCKKTQLKAVIQNDNLKVFDSITVNYYNKGYNIGQRAIKLVVRANKTIRLISTAPFDCYKINGTKFVDNLMECTIAADELYLMFCIVFPDADGKLVIKDAQNISSVGYAAQNESYGFVTDFRQPLNYSINIEDFNYISLIELVYSNYGFNGIYECKNNVRKISNFNGYAVPLNSAGVDLNTLSKAANSLTDVDIKSDLTFGNIESLSTCSKLTTVTVYGCNVTGNLDVLLQNLSSLKADDDVILFTIGGSKNKIYYNNELLNADKIKELNNSNVYDRLKFKFINGTYELVQL